MPLFKKKDMYYEKLKQEINDVAYEMELVTAKFEFQNQEDLIESCIYELNALEARYRHLLKEAKSYELKRQQSMAGGEGA